MKLRMRWQEKRGRTLFRVEALEAGSATLRACRQNSGRTTVFAAFERSCYVETAAGIACLGAGIGRGPLNILVKDFDFFPVGNSIELNFKETRRWTPPTPSGKSFSVPQILSDPWKNHREAQAFLGWIAGTGKPDDALIGLGQGLTPAGDDFAGGAMIALRGFGHAQLADRIAAWALPLAERNTNRISRAHLACAATGEGHEALHDLLCTFDEKHLERLSRIGHTSGLDAAAGALLALQAACAAVNPPSRRNPSRSWSTSPTR